MLTPILVVAAAHLLQGEGVGAAAAAHPKMKADFMRAMKASTNKARPRKLSASTRKKFREALEGHSERSAALRKKIIEKATVLKPPGGQRHLQNYNNYDDQAQANDGNNYNGQAQANGYNNNYNGQAQANGYGANGYNNRNGGYGANGYNNRNNNRNRNWKNADGDDYFAVYGEWNNAFGFDAAQYSLSYHRCAAVSQFDEEVAAREDSDTVFSTKQFAVFRFCPENTCMYDPDEDPEDEEEEYARQQEEWEAWQNGGGRWYGQGNGGQNQQQNYQEEEEDAQGQGQEEMAYKDGGRCMKYDDDGKCKYWRSCKSYDDDGECVRWRTCLRYDDDGECEEERLFGARGEGCQDNYGEYLVELQDYLGLMMEFQEEQFTKYCQYCEQCMYDVYMTWLANRQEHDGYWGGYQDDQMQQEGQNGQNGGRRLGFEEFKSMEEERRRLDDQQDEEQDDDPQAYNGNASPLFYHVCPEYDTCSEYKYTCENGIDEHYAEYFECQEVEKDNGIVAYVGPHCAEDGFTVTLGIYQDEYCGEYIGDGTRIENFIGEEVDYEEDALRSFYNSANGALDVLRFSNEEDVCIPCRKADNPYEEYVQQDEQYQYYPYAEEDEQYQEQYNQWYQEQQQERDDDEVDYKYNEYEISAICENLYMVSARCDKNYRSYTTKSKQAKYAEAIAQEDLTCDFIDSIVMGNYNEMGGVNLSEEYLSSQPSWMANSMYAQQYGHYLTEVTPLQVFGLLVSISAVVVLLAWSHSLRESLSKRGPWAPRRGAASGKASPSEEGINRQSSGIMMGRSMSNASYYMA